MADYIDAFAEAARRAASAAYKYTGAEGAVDYATEAYKQATPNLDKPGPDFTPQPFSAGEISDKGSGIARVLTNMMAARRDIANYKEAQRLKGISEQKTQLELDRLRQQVNAGTTSPVTIGGTEYQLTQKDAATIAARSNRGGSGSTGGKQIPILASALKDFTKDGKMPASWVPDPTDPTKGTINDKELAALQANRTASETVRSHGAAQSAAESRLALASESAGFTRELANLDDEEAAAGTRARADAQAEVTRDLSILGADHMKGMTSVQFEAKRNEIAQKYGLTPEISNGDVVKTESAWYLDSKNESPKVRGGGFFGIGAKRPELTVYNTSSSGNQAALSRYIDQRSLAATNDYRNNPDVVAKRRQLRDANERNRLQGVIVDVAAEQGAAVNPQPGNNAPRGPAFQTSGQARPGQSPNAPPPAAAPSDSTASSGTVATVAGRMSAAAVPDSVAATNRLVQAWASEDNRTPTHGARTTSPRPTRRKKP